MFSLKNAFIKKAAITGLGMVLLTGLLLFSCSNPANGTAPSDPEAAYIEADIPADLIGTWVGTEYGDEYTITATTFAAEGAYTGTIESHRSNGNAGYITIKYTENEYNPSVVGNYYVIHYKDLDFSSDPMSVSIAGAAFYDPDNLDDPYGSNGKATLGEAETEYTVTGGYFEWYSYCEKDDE